MLTLAEIGSAFVSIAPSTRGFGSSLNSQVNGPVRSVGRSVGSAFGKMFVLGAGVIAAAGIGHLLKDSIAEAREAQKVGAATSAIIKATGGAAKLSAKQIGSMATSLSNKIGVDDEEIQKGQNLLLTFKNVRNEVGKGADVFTRATTAGADLAAAGFGSIESNAKTLGKALNDPIKGITALTRSGVQFTEQQKDQIKGFVESGDLLSAQKIILGEVEHQVGGTAAATATAGEKAKVAFDNMKESIGTALLPAIDTVENAFVKMAPSIQKGIGQAGPLFARLRDALAPAIQSLKDALLPALKQVFGFFKANPKVLAVIAGIFLAMASPIAAVGVGLALLYIKSKTVRDGFAKVVETLQEFGTKAAPVVRDVLERIVETFKTQVIPAVEQGAQIFRNVILPAVVGFAQYVATSLVPVFQKIAQIVVTQVIPTLAKLAQFFVTQVVPAVVDIATSVGSSLKPTFDQLVVTLQTKILPTVEKLIEAFQRALPTIERVAVIVLKVVGFVIKLAAAILGKVLPVIIKLIGIFYARMMPALTDFLGGIGKVVNGVIDFGKKVGALAVNVKDKFGKIKDGASSLVSGVKDKFDSLVSFFKGLPGKIGGIFDGLWSGVANSLKSALNSVLSLPLTIPRIDTHIPGVGTVGGQTLIPALAKGGIVNQPTLALIGEAGPEMVVPLSGSGGGDVMTELRLLRAAVERQGGEFGREINSAMRGGYRRAWAVA